MKIKPSFPHLTCPFEHEKSVGIIRWEELKGNFMPRRKGGKKEIDELPDNIKNIVVTLSGAQTGSHDCPFPVEASSSDGLSIMVEPDQLLGLLAWFSETFSNDHKFQPAAFLQFPCSLGKSERACIHR